MKKIALLLAGASLSLGAAAQTGTPDNDGSLLARSSVSTTVLTVAAPVVLLLAVTLAAEDNDTPSAPATSPAVTSTATR
ncbi:MAG: hypothetical protein V4709_10140 [Pseudomonadota bacterium]